MIIKCRSLFLKRAFDCAIDQNHASVGAALNKFSLTTLFSLRDTQRSFRSSHVQTLLFVSSTAPSCRFKRYFRLGGEPNPARTCPAKWYVVCSTESRTFSLNPGIDNTTQCNPYYYAPVNSQLSSFPNIWEPASILQGDTNAEAKWDSMKGSVPNIPPKVRSLTFKDHCGSNRITLCQGTPLGDFSGLKYPDSDDDCWWTFSKCVDPKLDGVPDDVSEIPEVDYFPCVEGRVAI